MFERIKNAKEKTLMKIGVGLGALAIASLASGGAIMLGELGHDSQVGAESSNETMWHIGEGLMGLSMVSIVGGTSVAVYSGLREEERRRIAAQEVKVQAPEASGDDPGAAPSDEDIAVLNATYDVGPPGPVNEVWSAWHRQ